MKKDVIPEHGLTREAFGTPAKRTVKPVPRYFVNELAIPLKDITFLSEINEHECNNAYL